MWVPGDLAGRAGADNQTLRDAQRRLNPPPCSPHPAQPRVQPGPGGLPGGWDAQSLFSALPAQRRLLQNPFISARSRHVWLSHGDGWGGKEGSPEAEGQMKCLIRGGSCSARWWWVPLAPLCDHKAGDFSLSLPGTRGTCRSLHRPRNPPCLGTGASAPLGVTGSGVGGGT